MIIRKSQIQYKIICALLTLFYIYEYIRKLSFIYIGYYSIILIDFRTVCAIWQTLGKDQMCSQIIDTLIEFITLTPLYDTSTKQFLNKPVASLIPISVSII